MAQTGGEKFNARNLAKYTDDELRREFQNLQRAIAYYSEGTFTPGISFGGGTTGITYATQQGSYERIGKNVHVRFRVGLTSNGSSSGAVLITGLPFTIWNNAAGNAVGSVNYSGLAGLTDGVNCYTSINTTTLALAFGGAAATTQLTEANVTDTADVAGSITYRMD